MYYLVLMRRTVYTFCIAVLACPLTAVELPGIPRNGGLDAGTWKLAIGNDGLGLGGGGASDDFRTGHVGIGWEGGTIAIAADYSLLTCKNPSGAPVFWGDSDPFAASRVGAARSDEVTLAAAVRQRLDGETWRAWISAGPGLQVAGDLHGSSLQNRIHTLLGNAVNDLPYSHQGLQATGLVHAAGGGRWNLTGPLAVDAGVLGLTTTGGWTRWRAEAVVMALGAGGGVWAGVRQDGSGGHAFTNIADVVASHEDGLGIVLGAAFDFDEMRIGLETSHSLTKNGQDGTVTLAWTPERLPQSAPAGSTPWYVRPGISGQDSRVSGHGADLVVGSAPTVWPLWLQVVCGIRDQRISTPYTFDISGQRLLLWGGLAAEPVLIAGSFGAITARCEVGLGWRRTTIETHGFTDVDGRQSEASEAPLGRLAAGLGARIPTDLGTVGLAFLLEAISAPQRSAEVHVHDPINGSIQDQREVPLDGNSIGGVLGITATCTW